MKTKIFNTLLVFSLLADAYAVNVREYYHHYMLLLNHRTGIITDFGQYDRLIWEIKHQPAAMQHLNKSSSALLSSPSYYHQRQHFFKYKTPAIRCTHEIKRKR